MLAVLCAVLGTLALGGGQALAAAPATPETRAAVDVSNTSAVLEGIVNPNNRTSVGWYFAYATGGAGCSGGSETPLQPEAEYNGAAASAELTGLQPGTQYSFCLIVRNSAEETTAGPYLTFTTSALAPAVEDEFPSEAGARNIALNAKLNPHGSPGRYHFEYGTSEAYGASTPTQLLPANPGDVPAIAQVTGLQPDTAYRARVIVEGTFGRSIGGGFGFSTDSVQDGQLPDGRVLEMVTPLSNDDAEIYAPGLPNYTGIGAYPVGTGSLFQAAVGGEAITYISEPVSGGNGSSGDSSSGGHTGDQLLAKRTASGWTQEVISASGRNHSYYEAFSSDLSVGILRAGNGYAETTALLPEAAEFNGGYHVLYERDDTSHDERALFTHFTQSEHPGPYGLHPLFVGGSSDFSTKVFDANAALSPGAPVGENVYEVKGAQLSLANVLPDGTLEPDAQAGGPEEADDSEEGSSEFSHAVSADGSRVFWTGLESHPNLYMREDGSRTVQLDASQAVGPGGHGHFWTASSDGERVFFTDDAAAGLTSDTVPASGANLYEYDVGDGRLTDLTATADARVEAVVGASEDGGYVYFVADGVLAPGAAVGDCEGRAGAATAHCDLYVSHDGTTRFVSPLTQQDGLGGPTGSGGGVRGDWVTGQGGRSAEVSASGSVVFESTLSLTGYRNEGLSELYAYDPAVLGGAGSLICVSCDPSGSPPSDEVFTGAPAGLLPVSHNPAHAARLISDDGSRIFFDGAVPLVPQDTNGEVDAYEWERAGAGTCTLTDGCLYLLTGGKSDDGSFVIEASASGDDAFVLSRAQLVEADRNENYDVYDARVDGARATAAPACTGAGCQGVPPAPPIFATPSSVTFEGVGNFAAPAASAVKPKSLTKAQMLAKALRACGKKPRKQRAACERRARQRYAAKSKSKRSAKGGK
jgi:hypothetical protein